ncbi:MAG: type 1 glutamine amidotransferase, partial [Verrucomicrobia bacterium]|nr:type 1 glutamine amidotransferase [Verrucomicrobiota bacterium]
MSEFILIQHQATEGPGTIEEEILRAGHQVRKVRTDQGDKVPGDVGAFAGLV